MLVGGGLHFSHFAAADVIYSTSTTSRGFDMENLSGATTRIARGTCSTVTLDPAVKLLVLRAIEESIDTFHRITVKAASASTICTVKTELFAFEVGLERVSETYKCENSKGKT